MFLGPRRYSLAISISNKNLNDVLTLPLRKQTPGLGRNGCGTSELSSSMAANLGLEQSA